MNNDKERKANLVEIRDILRNELGEILMYLTRTIYHSGLTLDEVMQYNVDVQNNRQEYENIINRDIFKRK